MILVKTDAGQQVLKDRSVRLTPRQRSAFILCDGKRSIDDVVSSGMGVGREDIEHMVELGLLGPVHGADTPEMAAPTAPVHVVQPPSVVATASVAVAAPRLVTESAPLTFAASVQAGAALSRQQRYQDAYPIATRLTGGLGLRGFRLNLAVEGTSNYEELLALAPKIRSAVGPDKSADLDRALGV